MNDFGKLAEDMDKLISCISSKSIRDFTKEMVHSASLAWQRPASLHHHLQDERGAFGNLLHGVRVASLCKIVAESVDVVFGLRDYAYHLEPNAGDVLLSASILHDIDRYGLFGMADVSVPNHPQLVREHASAHNLTCEHFELIMAVVEGHMGKWSQPTPVSLSIDACTALHLADLIVARWAEVMPSGGREDTIDHSV